MIHHDMNKSMPQRKTPNQISEEKVLKDLEVIEQSEEDIQRDGERFYIHEKESQNLGI